MQIEQTFTGSQSFQKIKYTNQSTLLQLLQSIFDDVTLYNDTEIRAIVEKSEKGFVTVEEIMALGAFREFCQRNGDVFVTPDQMCRVVNQQSRKLVAVNYRIKRVQPFIDNISNKTLKSIYIQKLPNKSTPEIYEYFKNVLGTVYQIYHKKNERWAIIVIDNYQTLDRIKTELYFGDNKLTVLNPIETLTSYGENQRRNSDFYLVRLYSNKCLFQDCQGGDWGFDGGFQEDQDFMDNHPLKPNYSPFQDEFDRQFMQNFPQSHAQIPLLKPPKNYNPTDPTNSISHPSHPSQSLNENRNKYKLTQHFQKQYKKKVEQLAKRMKMKREFQEVMNFDNRVLLELRDGYGYHGDHGYGSGSSGNRMMEE